MDAFKNFIRHGKHARTNQQAATAEPTTTHNVPSKDERARLAAEEAKRHAKAEREREDKAAALKDRAHHTQAAEAIVKEERAAKDKMPTIKGLERFRLLDKMGDGAFSNVYKALDLTSGQKVAIKVVRKYELNATQVGFSRIFLFSHPSYYYSCFSFCPPLSSIWCARGIPKTRFGE
ncbi:hypothetical protein M408DRAFT_209120 [Serendipita vermifera MAFF 305830]|uniref:Protein kinase domain-containing protein n=1 Tax=Serendipita vermifera MAFF 305830 TaxID=933852 RepID=A0A0C3B287_SERVB|nr:hypothetical protein M408DRAFT_209120 [Serendipita vermifera MAFF 305830]